GGDTDVGRGVAPSVTALTRRATSPWNGEERETTPRGEADLAGGRESVKGPPMRFAFRRSALFAAASLIALGIAAPSLAQEAPQTLPSDAAPAQVDAEPSAAT